MVRPYRDSDLNEVLSIYNYYISNSIATFDVDEFSLNQMKEKIRDIKEHYPILVFEENNSIIGYTYANKWALKCAYYKTIESTIYIHHKHHSKGVGYKLYKELVSELSKANVYHSIVGGISLPNEASIHLHEKLGFVKAAHFREIGHKFGEYIDVAYWELLLDS